MPDVIDLNELQAVNEPTYTFGSVDNVRAYPFEKNLSSDSDPSSKHGVLYAGQPLAIFGASGGASGIHPNSLMLVKGLCYLAVGDHVVCFCPHPFSFKWALKTDMATCFGVHYQHANDALISHGELEISRFSADGKLMWSASGADIFSEGIFLKTEFVEVIDFNGNRYHFNYESGAEDV